MAIGADGRHSTIRQLSNLALDDLGAPMDVLWLRLPRRMTDPEQPLGYFSAGKAFIMIYREHYWQCRLVIPKRKYGAIQQRGIASFRENIATLVPFLRDRVAELESWDDIKLLMVAVDRLPRWYLPGLLCIGDAAHAMSSIGGVGINLAIQDAVATANRLALPLRTGRLTLADLRSVQRRRLLPTRLTQRLQIIIQNRVISRVIGSRDTIRLPWPLKLMRRWPMLRRLPARVIGMGFLPEHVDTPDA